MTLAAASPRDRAGLAALMARAPSEDLTFIAGGTDLLVAPRALPEQGLIVDLSRVRDLAFVEARDGAVRIGAATTLATLAGDPLIRAHCPALAQAAELCGSVQIRNRATIGGNVATASPASDLTPVLACLDAHFLVMSKDGERRADFDAVLPPAGGARLTPGEAIVDVVIPAGAGLGCSAFAKLGPRDDLAIARLNLALAAELERGRFGAVRLVAGALAPAPRRLHGVEDTLSGRPLDGATWQAFASALLAEVDAAIPGRASHAYKRRAILGLGYDLLARLTGRADPGGLE